MNDQEKLNKQTSVGNPGNDILSDYGKEFEMGAELKFEEACKKSKEELNELDAKYREAGRHSSFGQTFSGFAKTCKEKSEECIEAATDRVIELAKMNDPEVAVLAMSRRAGISGGRWASKGEMGTGEYIFEVLGSKCNPQNIGRLETMSKTMPSSDFNRFENMRMDAYRIDGIVIQGRSFIHDCAPEAYRLIDSMVAYYDAKDNLELSEKKREELANLLSELREKHGAGYTNSHEDLMFNLENYDKIVKEYSGDGVGGLSSKSGEDKIINNKTGEAELIYDGKTSGEVKAIDILRRLQHSMEPVPIKAPETKIPQLNEAFERLGTVPINEQTGKIMVSVNELSDILAVMNSYLIENQGKRMLFPSTISAIAYIDKLAAEAVQGVQEKDWREMAFDPTFKELIRFTELTMSGGYSEAEFEQFYNKFRAKASEAYGDDDINDDKISEAYKMISELVSKNAVAVADEFSDNPRLKYLAKAVWSGNLTHELIGLFDR